MDIGRGLRRAAELGLAGGEAAVVRRRLEHDHDLIAVAEALQPGRSMYVKLLFEGPRSHEDIDSRPEAVVERFMTTVVRAHRNYFQRLRSWNEMSPVDRVAFAITDTATQAFTALGGHHRHGNVAIGHARIAEDVVKLLHHPGGGTMVVDIPAEDMLRGDGGRAVARILGSAAGAMVDHVRGHLADIAAPAMSAEALRVRARVADGLHERVGRGRWTAYAEPKGPDPDRAAQIAFEKGGMNPFGRGLPDAHRPALERGRGRAIGAGAIPPERPEPGQSWLGHGG